MEQVWRTVERYRMLKRGDRVLVGVSGGPDSVALLHLLDSRRAQYGVELFVVHVDHRLRPEAETEARYVGQLAARLGLPFRRFTVDVAEVAAARGLSLEQAGHEARFACFREAAAQWHANKLALGHHRGDRAESVLLHLIQGCGLDGLAAMPPVDGWIIRPLAEVDKAQLTRYCEAEGLDYFTDASNLEPSCLRNQVRLELLPLLRRYNSRIADALLRLSETSAADADYLAQCTEALWQTHGAVQNGEARLSAQALDGLHTALARRLLRRMYRALTGNERDLSFAQVEAMRALAAGRDGSRALSLAGGVTFLRRYDQLILRYDESAARGQNSAARGQKSAARDEKNVARDESDVPRAQNDAEREQIWDLSAPFAFPAWNTTLTAAFATREQTDGAPADVAAAETDGLWQVAVDADKLADALTVRTRRPGDMVQPLGMQGRKKLKDYLIDRKIPHDVRDRLPLVLSGGEIIWIPGCFLSERVKIDARTARVCLLCCERKPRSF